MHTGLYFGTFNPIHNGHLAIAEAMYQTCHFDAIWMIISPNSPFKQYSELVDENIRYRMLCLAIEDYPYIKASKVEFDMPKPNYTYATLRKLTLTYPEEKFSLIMGSDNLENIRQWKNYEEILQNHTVYVYPRGEKNIACKQKNITIVPLPLLKISSTELRKKLQEGKDCSREIPAKTLQFILNQHLYK
ncbi:MAG: nicotinate-nucleotide adenylyltransferase [Bacteroidales bacterium]|nr:nicotinate-nucleotide adenylyltransferase [Bacteroidales bacterium]